MHLKYYSLLLFYNLWRSWAVLDDSQFILFSGETLDLRTVSSLEYSFQLFHHIMGSDNERHGKKSKIGNLQIRGSLAYRRYNDMTNISERTLQNFLGWESNEREMYLQDSVTVILHLSSINSSGCDSVWLVVTLWNFTFLF